MVRVEAGIYCVQGKESTNEQYCPNEKHKGEGDFADDEQRASPVVPEAGSGAVAAFLQGGIQVDA